MLRWNSDGQLALARQGDREFACSEIVGIDRRCRGEHRSDRHDREAGRPEKRSGRFGNGVGLRRFDRGEGKVADPDDQGEHVDHDRHRDAAEERDRQHPISVADAARGVGDELEPFVGEETDHSARHDRARRRPFCRREAPPFELPDDEAGNDEEREHARACRC